MSITIENTLRHVLFLARHLNNCDPQCAVVAALIELGIPTKRVGFDYLKNAIIMLHREPTRMLTKEIYPAVGQLYTPEVSPFLVEQAIRAVVEEAWRDRDDNIWKCYFPQTMSHPNKRPSNAEFISQIVRFVELWEGCRKEAVNET